MAKIKFDVSDVEPREDFDVPIPKGVYKMRILEIEDTTSGKDGRPMFKVEMEIAEGDHKGRRIWDYIKYEDDSSAWKLQQLVQALKLGAKGTLDTKKAEGEIVVVKVKHESDPEYNDGEPSAKVGSMMPLPEGAAEEEAEEEEEVDGDGEEGEEITADDINGMNKAELKDLIEEQELGLRVTKKTKVANLRVKVIEALGLDEEPEDEEIETPEDYATLSAMSADEVAALIGQEELDVDPDDLADDKAICDAVAEELGIDVPEGDEDEDGLDYDEMSVAELKGECDERGLPSKGGKKALIKRLESDDEGDGDDGSDPF